MKRIHIWADNRSITAPKHNKLNKVYYDKNIATIVATVKKPDRMVGRDNPVARVVDDGFSGECLFHHTCPKSMLTATTKEHVNSNK